MIMFNGNEGTVISEAVAAGMNANWRAKNKGKVKGVFYGKNKLHDILTQEGCMGIRIYFSELPTGELTAVLVGVDSNEADMVSGIILDMGVGCPTSCTVSSLNT